MVLPIPVVVNRSGGTAASLGDDLRDRIEDAFVAAGLVPRIELVDGDQIAAAVRRASRAPVIVVGGGDGTLSAAAGILTGTDCALAILPLGTRNHLARQLEVPLDLAEAAALVRSGDAIRIDVGMAEERVFLNNASFGLYTRFVDRRERAHGAKWLRSAIAGLGALRQVRTRRFDLDIDCIRSTVQTPLLFVGNNEYALADGVFGTRTSLRDGRLSLYALPPRPPLALAALALRAISGRLREDRDLQLHGSARSLVIRGRGRVEAALDGEVLQMDLPLEIAIAPRALQVIVPSAGVAVPDRPARRARQNRL